MKVPINSLIEPTSVIRPVNEFEQALMEDSMSEHGLLSPLTVCNNVIVDGYRRWLVARGLGWTEIDVHTVEGDPDLLRVITQTRVSEFGKTEKKVLVGQYLERNPDATANEIGHSFKWSPIEVEQLVGVGYLVPEARELYEARTITLYTVWYLARVLDQAQLELLEGEIETLHERAEAHLREVKAARRRSLAKRPRTKSFNMIAKEAEHPVYAGEKLIQCDAKTPLDGWKAALRWVIEGK